MSIVSSTTPTDTQSSPPSPNLSTSFSTPHPSTPSPLTPKFPAPTTHTMSTLQGPPDYHQTFVSHGPGSAHSTPQQRSNRTVQNTTHTQTHTHATLPSPLHLLTVPTTHTYTNSTPTTPTASGTTSSAAVAQVDINNLTSLISQRRSTVLAPISSPNSAAPSQNSSRPLSRKASEIPSRASQSIARPVKVTVPDDTLQQETFDDVSHADAQITQDYIMHPFSLLFINRQTETQFRILQFHLPSSSASPHPSPSTLHSSPTHPYHSDAVNANKHMQHYWTFLSYFVFTLLYCFATIPDIVYYQDSNKTTDQHDGYRLRIILKSIGMGLQLALFSFIHYLRAHNQLLLLSINQLVFSLFLFISGSIWTIGTVIGNDKSLEHVNALHTCAFLIVSVLLGRCFLFIYLALANLGISIIFIVFALVFKSSVVQSSYLEPLLHVGYVFLIFSILCYSHFNLELSQRYTYLTERDLFSSKAELMNEKKELRQEVYELVLEKFDLTEIEEKEENKLELYLQSPVENIMKILQAMQKDKEDIISKKHFDQINQIMKILSSTSASIFRPKKEQVTSIKLDEDTNRWLTDLVDDGEEVVNTDNAANNNTDNNNANTPLQTALNASEHSSTDTTNYAEHSPGNCSYNPSVRISIVLTDDEHKANDEDTNQVKIQIHIDENSKPPTNVRSNSAGNCRTATSSNPTPMGALASRPSHSNSRDRSGSHNNYVVNGVLVGKNGSLSSIISPSSSLSSDEEKAISALQDSLEDWSFDVFSVCQLTKNRPLFFMGIILFRKFGLIQKLKMDKIALVNFLNAIEQGYQSDKPYHNSTHAADVTRSVYFFLTKGNLRASLSDVEICAALTASLIHDFDHPGVNNNFLIRTKDEKAILYNDRSVLENHHVSSCFRLMYNKSAHCHFLSHLGHKQMDEFRKLVIEMVLATDLGQHFEILTHFRNAMGSLDYSSEASRLLVLKMALKCADVGHAAKPANLHNKWTWRIIEEFYQQGDKEREKGLPISPFMDRNKANVAKAQTGFINFLVLPMYELFISHLNLPEEKIPCLVELKKNRDFWQNHQV